MRANNFFEPTHSQYVDPDKLTHGTQCVLQASLLISDGAYKTKMRTSEKYFKPVKTWFGYDSTEKIEGWKTKIFEASGKMMAITITKVFHSPYPVNYSAFNLQLFKLPEHTHIIVLTIYNDFHAQRK